MLLRWSRASHSLAWDCGVVAAAAAASEPQSTLGSVDAQATLARSLAITHCFTCVCLCVIISPAAPPSTHTRTPTPTHAQVCAACNEASLDCSAGVYKAVGAPTEASLKVRRESSGQ